MANRSANHVGMPQPVSAARHHRSHLPSLDGARGIAVLTVFFFHYGGGATSPHLLLHTIGTIKKFGWSGVDLFFVLSGFLITGILYDTRNEHGYFLKFYARRALRLFPLIYGIAIVLLLLTPVLHLHWQAGQIVYLFYGANIISYFHPQLNGIPPYFALAHLWSLAVEEQFYLFWPLLVFFVPQRKRLMRVCVFLTLAALALRVGLYASGTVNVWFLFMETPCRMDSLAIGGFLALLLRNESSEPPRWLSPVLFWGGTLAVVALAIAGHSLNSTSPEISTFGFTFVAIMAAGFLLAALETGSLINRICNNRALRRCGKYSYGIYVYHVLINPILFPLLPFYTRRFHSMAIGGALYISLSFILVFAISALSYELYEKPWIKLKSRFAYSSEIRVPCL